MNKEKIKEFKDWVKDEITNLEEKLTNELVTPEDYEDQTSSLDNILEELEFFSSGEKGGKQVELKEKIEKIADHYGAKIQLLKLAEEAAEYVAAVQKWNIYIKLQGVHPKAKKHFERLEEKAGADCRKELADVLCLARQIEYLIGNETEAKVKLEKAIEEKCDRQLKRIEEEKQND